MNFEIMRKYKFFLLILISVILVILSFFAGRYFTKINTPNIKSDELAVLFNEPDLEPTDLQKTVPSDEDKVFLKSKLKEIFPGGWEQVSEEKRAIEINRYIASALKLQDNLGNATKILKDGYANCSGMAYAFRILARQAGLPARYNALFNTPGQGGHNLTGVYFDNSWHLFDPTYGVFVYSNPTYDSKGHILSLEELRKDNQAGFIFQTVGTPWIGEYKKSDIAIEPVKDDFAFNLYKQKFDTFWREEIKKSFPLAYSAQSLVSHPVDVDLENQDSLLIGQKDGKSNDIDGVLNKFHGSSYLGKTEGITGAYNTFLVKAKAPQNIVIRYWTIDKKEDFDFNLVRLRGVQLMGTESYPDHFEFHLEILDSPANFLVLVDRGIVVNDAIEISKE